MSPPPAPARTLMPSAWRLGGLSLRALGARLWIRLWEDEILDRAAGLSYYFLFALFPTLLYLTLLVGLLPTPDLMDRFMDYTARVLPDDAASLLRRAFVDVLRGAGSGVLSLGMLAALWGASSGMGSIMAVLNKAWGVQDQRPWWQQRLIAIALTIWFSLFTLTALLLLVFGERIGEAVAGSLGFGSVFTRFWNVLRWPALVVFLLMGVSLVYYLARRSRGACGGSRPARSSRSWAGC
ncbi:MAG: YihY/virulence factor BrkB family protein [Candidatus Rokuibacteriota bacterium]